MNKITWEDSIDSFVNQASSSSPTPGGGSVAALVAVLGAAMTSMVGNLSQGEKFADIEPQIFAVIHTMNHLNEECRELFDGDIASFNNYMEALKLPKETEEEKLARKQAIYEATINAIEVPVQLMEVCRTGIECAYGIAETSNKNVISDLGISAILFEAAAQSALLTVEINLASLKDLELKQQYADKVSSLMQEISDLKNQASLIIQERIQG
ncbi:cyclodeaminase/cyclohydrolase family protein [Paenibacillus sp. D2_2]|uniref:cyclodeaminase/cyclohydrolase family protein n=1 Tax=Paenibacillus sp. D2_2 TaxID=3073092 RepID=UPI002816996A|nr:cyclodeaminase/cyclohydrolase family protein [Paenibacillus sp. D2_2]WMT39861.1 cyclodeaminase/cyclohydrolase family protein [Paenibacillus sp. D2_2]